MIMNKTGFIGLMSVTILAMGAAFWLMKDEIPDPKILTLDPPQFFPDPTTIIYTGSKEQNKKKEQDLYDRLNKISRIRIISAKENLTLARLTTEKTWILPDKAHYPADFSKIRQTLIALSSLNPIEPRTKDPEWHHRLGLQSLDQENSTATQVTVSIGEQEFASFLVGKAGPPVGPDQETRYVRKTEDAQSWLVEGVPEFSTDPMNWLDRSIIDLRRERLWRIEVLPSSDQNGYNLERADPESSQFKMSPLPKGRESRGENGFNQIISALEFLDLDDVTADPNQHSASVADKLAVRFTTYGGLQIETRFLDLPAVADKKADMETMADEINRWVSFAARIVEAQTGLVAAKQTEYAKTDAELEKMDAPKTGALKTDGLPPAPNPARIRDAKAIAKEVADFNKRHKGWIYKLPRYKLTAFETEHEDLLVPLTTNSSEHSMPKNSN